VSLEAILERAAGQPARILLAGGSIDLLDAAAERLHQAGVPGVGVVGTGRISPEQHPRLSAVASLLRAREPNRVRDAIDALDLAADPVRFGAGLVALGEVDALVTGAGVTPRDLATAHRWTLGGGSNGRPICSVSWLLMPDGAMPAFADGAFADDCSPAALARLAAAIVVVQRALGAESVEVVFLSGPTDALDEGPAGLAMKALRGLDAGIQAEASASLRFRGRGNVFIFPDRTSAHLAARAVRALPGTRLLGPLLLGGAGTVAGVAEDAGVDELVGTAAVAALASGNATA
jgi:phosphotransacetylase